MNQKFSAGDVIRACSGKTARIISVKHDPYNQQDGQCYVVEWMLDDILDEMPEDCERVLSVVPIATADSGPHAFTLIKKRGE